MKFDNVYIFCVGLWHCVVIFFGTYLLQRNGVSMFESGVVSPIYLLFTFYFSHVIFDKVLLI